MKHAKTTGQCLFAGGNLRILAHWDGKNLQFQDEIANYRKRNRVMMLLEYVYTYTSANPKS